jgi:hypothetical protein
MNSSPTIRFVDKGRRTLNGDIYDVIDYTFEISQDGPSSTINVGLTGVWYTEIPALHRKLTDRELETAAEKWLRTRLRKGYDPLADPKLERILTIPSVVMDYYVTNWEIPEHI